MLVPMVQRQVSPRHTWCLLLCLVSVWSSPLYDTGRYHNRLLSGYVSQTRSTLSIACSEYSEKVLHSAGDSICTIKAPSKTLKSTCGACGGS